jgi:hypothetical protein
MNFISKIILIFIVISFNSCTTSKILTNYFSKKDDFVNFVSIAKDLIKPICRKINTGTTLYISDFVNESNLKNRSQLGFLFSNQIKVNILKPYCSKNITIQDLQLAKTFKISKNGSRILSRNIKELKNTVLLDDKQILVGSYIISNKQIIIFLKLITLKHGTIIASSTTSRLITDEIKALEGLQTKEDLKTKKNLNIYKPMHL